MITIAEPFGPCTSCRGQTWEFVSLVYEGTPPMAQVLVWWRCRHCAVTIVCGGPIPGANHPGGGTGG